MKKILAFLILLSISIFAGCSNRPRHPDQDIMSKPTQERYLATEI